METEVMESWRQTWRKGIAPVLSTKGLLALEKGLREDDRTLLQGATTSPPPLQCVESWPCEGACFLGYAGWKGEGLETVGDVEAFFARVCWEADQRLGEPAACRWFLNFADDTPRAQVRSLLLVEVRNELQRRKASKEAA